MAIPSQAEGNFGRCRDWTGGTYNAHCVMVKGQSRPQTLLGGVERRSGRLIRWLWVRVPRGPPVSSDS